MPPPRYHRASAGGATSTPTSPRSRIGSPGRHWTTTAKRLKPRPPDRGIIVLRKEESAPSGLADCGALSLFVNITCFSAILLLSLSHIPPASDPPPPPHLPCGPAPVLTGEDEALAATRKLPAVALSASRGVERCAGFGFDHHFLDLGAEPRLHVIRDGLQNSRLFDRDNLPETLDYCGLDALRVLRGQFAVLPRASRLLHQRLVRFL